MPSISISQFTQYYNSGTATKKYTATGTGSTRLAAQSNAQSAARSAAGAGGGSVTVSNGGSSSSDKNFGTYLTFSTGAPAVTGTSYITDETGNYWFSKAQCEGKSTGTAYQLKLGFALPEGVTSDIISTATMTINYSTSYGSGNSYSFALYAPKTTSNQINYQKPSASNIIQSKDTFSIVGGSTSKTLDIKSALQQCITNNQYWLTLGRDSDSASSSPRIYVSSVIIDYTLTFTANNAPTSVTSSIAIQKPTGTATITWSGDSAGTNVNIAGYTVYWKTGEAPTLDSYTGSAVVALSANKQYTFTVPDNRGVTYYFRVVANSDIAGYDSSITSSPSATVKVNTLPNAPGVGSNKTRVLSSGTDTVTFTITPGTDSDGQSLTTYWSTSIDGAKTAIVNNTYTTGAINTGVTYYFWNYDGLEYGPYTNKLITVNIAPTISSFSMIPIATYTPSINSRDFVTDISIAAPTVTKDPNATLTYNWKFLTGDATSSSAPATAQKSIGSATSYNKIDVTTYGVGFNNSYKLQLTITDDIGEAVTATSSNEFCVPAAPTITIINQQGDSNVANAAHFGRYIRVKYQGYGSPAVYNNGFTKKLQYSLTDDFDPYESISLTGSAYTDVDLNNLARNTSYRFRVQYTCNTISTVTSYTIRTRAKDITPKNITVTPAPSGATTVKPYSHNVFNVSFTNQPLSFVDTEDVATTYEDIYTTSIEYSTRSLSMTSSGSDSQGTVTSTWTLNNKATSDWITLINGSSSTVAPNISTTVKLKIVAQNQFGETFPGTETYKLDFTEGFVNLGTATLQIKTGSSSWASIPTSYNTDSISTRYPTFQTQTLRISYSGLQTKANQDVNVYFMDGNTELGKATIDSSEWTAPSSGSYTYTLSGSKYIEYVLPNNTGNDGILKNYSVKVTMVTSGTTSTISNTSNLNSTVLHRIAPNSMNFTLTDSTEDRANEQFNVTWTCTDFGGSVQGTKYSNGYASVSLQLQYCATPTGTYTDIGSAVSLSNVGTPSIAGTGTLQSSTTSVVYDIVYFGAKVVIELKFTQISGATPTGTSSYTFYSLNRSVLYRKVPNLLYGKNFFVLNGSAPAPGVTDQILELHTTDTRNTVYISNMVGDSYATIRMGTDITLDNFVINGGTWNSN